MRHSLPFTPTLPTKYDETFPPYYTYTSNRYGETIAPYYTYTSYKVWWDIPSLLHLYFLHGLMRHSLHITPTLPTRYDRTFPLYYTYTSYNIWWDILSLLHLHFLQGMMRHSLPITPTLPTRFPSLLHFHFLQGMKGHLLPIIPTFIQVMIVLSLPITPIFIEGMRYSFLLFSSQLDIRKHSLQAGVLIFSQLCCWFIDMIIYIPIGLSPNCMKHDLHGCNKGSSWSGCQL